MDVAARKACACCEYRVPMHAHILCFACYVQTGGYDFRALDPKSIARGYTIVLDEAPDFAL